MIEFSWVKYFRLSKLSQGVFSNLQTGDRPLPLSTSYSHGDQGNEMKKILQTLNMCDFCTHERKSCGAELILSQDVTLKNGSKLDSQEAVVACDKYASPVELLKKKFH